jgi:hypothetical protein
MKYPFCIRSQILQSIGREKVFNYLEIWMLNIFVVILLRCWGLRKAPYFNYYWRGTRQHKISGMKKVAFLLLSVFLTAVPMQSTPNSGLQDLLEEVKAGRVVIQNSSAAFLVICKNLGADQISEKQQSVRIVRPVASIRESDLVSSAVLAGMPAGTLLPVLKKEGEWYRVRLEDTREGWIHLDDVQQLYEEEHGKKKNPGRDNESYQQGRLLAEFFFQQLSAAFQKTDQQIAGFEKLYLSLSADGQRNAGNLYEELNRERELIRLSRAYSNHYYHKLGPLQDVPPEGAIRSQAIGFDGEATVRFGSSAYQSGSQISETTRNISLAGNLIFNPQSRLALQLNHNNDVITSPYTSSDVNLAYHYEAPAGTRLRTSFNYQNYEDQLLNQNSYMNLVAGVNIEHPLSATTRVVGDVHGQTKSFDLEGGNDLQGIQFNTLIDYRGEKALVNAGIRGRVQSSDIGFLDYQRLIPNFRLTYRTDGGNISFYAEGEQLTYGPAAGANNFNRIRADLEHSNSGNRVQFSLISKQFPNRDNFDNLKFRILRQRSHRSAGRYGRSTIYAQYTYHTNDLSLTGNFLDLRYDRNFSKSTSYMDIGVFGQYQEDAGRDHRLGVYSRFGASFSGIQIGPVVGFDIMIDPDDPDLKRTGNSFRAGVDGRGNFMIRQATIYSQARYQQTLLYTGFTSDGDPETRNPFTLEITAGARIPIARLFDLHLDLRYYSLDFDYPDMGEVLPVQKQSGLRYLGGISYRF